MPPLAKINVMPLVTQSESSATEGRSRSCKKSRVVAPAPSTADTAAVTPTTITPTAPTIATVVGGGPSATSDASPAKRSRRSGGGVGSSPADEAKRKQVLMARLDTQLARHKDMLKKDILKKRAILEKDLQLQIHVSTPTLSCYCQYTN